jgi:secondary thiamine-phosphate synthase enzyme
MQIFTDRIKFKTQGNSDIINVTEDVARIIEKSGLKDGIVNVFVPGATGALTTIEYEPGLVGDLKDILEAIVKEKGDYGHNRTHSDGNATAHVRASLLGPSITIPFEGRKMILGIWQSIIFVDMDNRPRDRELIVKLLGK